LRDGYCWKCHISSPHYALLGHTSTASAHGITHHETANSRRGTPALIKRIPIPSTLTFCASPFGSKNGIAAPTGNQEARSRDGVFTMQSLWKRGRLPERSLPEPSPTVDPDRVSNFDHRAIDASSQSVVCIRAKSCDAHVWCATLAPALARSPGSAAGKTSLVRHVFVHPAWQRGSLGIAECRTERFACRFDLGIGSSFAVHLLLQPLLAGFVPAKRSRYLTKPLKPKSPTG